LLRMRRRERRSRLSWMWGLEFSLLREPRSVAMPARTGRFAPVAMR
jgi:hypothetical protein